MGRLQSHVVRHCCKSVGETWSFVPRVEHRLRVLEITELRRTLGYKSKEVAEERRKLHFEELPNFYSFYSDNVRYDEMDRACGTMGDKRYSYRILVGNLKEEDCCAKICIAGRII